MTTTHQHQQAKVAFAVDEVSRLCSVSRSLIYEEMKSGRLRAIKIGKRRLIMKIDLDLWLARFPTA